MNACFLAPKKEHLLLCLTDLCCLAFSLCNNLNQRSGLHWEAKIYHTPLPSPIMTQGSFWNYTKINFPIGYQEFANFYWRKHYTCWWNRMLTSLMNPVAVFCRLGCQLVWKSGWNQKILISIRIQLILCDWVLGAAVNHQRYNEQRYCDIQQVQCATWKDLASRNFIDYSSTHGSQGFKYRTIALRSYLMCITGKQN